MALTVRSSLSARYWPQYSNGPTYTYHYPDNAHTYDALDSALNLRLPLLPSNHYISHQLRQRQHSQKWTSYIMR
jgi:hypothetical protein